MKMVKTGVNLATKFHKSKSRNPWRPHCGLDLALNCRDTET